MPVILAPLSGGPGSPELVSECCNAGIFGFYGGAYLSEAELSRDIQKIKSLTKKPFGVNLFVPSPEPVLNPDQVADALQVTLKYRDELGIPQPKVGPPYFESWPKQLEVILSEKPAVFSFTFGLLPEKDIQRMKYAGIEVVGTATTLEEAVALQKIGVDAVCIQGTEAGGHRGIFDVNADEPNISMRDLLKQCVATLKVPVIAAGGIMTGADVAEVIGFGATAAQMGTAFLLCKEAGTTASYREALRKKCDTTKLTRVFSGRLARGLENRFMKEMSGHAHAILPWPAQNFFTRDIRKACYQSGSYDFLSLWAGTEISKIRELPAREFIEIIFGELQKVSQS